VLPFLLIFISLFAIIHPIKSQEKTWTNFSANQLWNDPLNWSPVGVPSATDSVLTTYSDFLTIPASHVASIKYFKLLGNLTIETGAVLNITNGHFNSNGDVLNQGTININNSPTYGLKHSSFQSNSRPIINEGSIFIDNSADAGLWIRYDQTFTNKAGAVVEITNSGEAGIELLGTLSNQGIIRTRTSAIDLGLLMEDPESSFVNLNCSEANFKDKLVISDGLLNNFGLLRETSAAESQVSPGLIINYEIIEGLNYSIFVFDINNLGLWIKDYDEQILEGEPTEIFIGGAPISANVSDVFLEKELINNAGTYDKINNIWIPNANAVGNSTFFVEYTQDNGACSDIIKFNTQSTIESINFWKGGTGNWQFGVNWNYGSVPTPSDRVAIYGETDDVTIPLGYEAFAKDLLVKGKLTTNILSKLTIDNPSVDRGLVVLEGEVVNNGTLDFKNTKTGAYLSDGVLTNNGQINCSGHNVCIDLTRLSGLDGSTLINNGSIYSDTARAIQSFRSTINNYATITAELDGEGLAVEGDTIFNYGTLNIKGAGVLQSTGIDSYLNNKPSGIVNISRLDIGFYCSGANEGEINIDSCATGVLTPASDFFNLDGGVFNIAQCLEGIDISFTEFFNQPGGQVFLKKNEVGINMPSSSELYNKGYIQIDSTLTYGIYNQGNIFNELSARIIIDNTNINGIYLDGSNADIYCRDQSQILIRRSTGSDLLLEDGNLWIEDIGEVKIGADPEE